MSPLVELLVKASAILGFCLLLGRLVPGRLPALRHRVLLTGLLLLVGLPVSVALPPLIPVPLHEAPAELPSVGLSVAVPQVEVALPPDPPKRLPLWLAGGYGLGALLLLVRWLRDQGALRRLLRSARPSGLATPFPTLLVSEPTIPLACGVWQRRILLPEEALTWEPERLSAIVGHEASHLRRHDPLWQSLTELLCALWWFHPLVWLAAQQLRATAEAACDRSVLDSGIAPHDYAHHLLEVAVMFQDRPIAPALSRRSTLEGRLKTILAYAPAPITRWASLSLVATAVLALPILTARPVAQAQTPPPAPQEERKRLAEKEEKRAREIEALKNRDAALRDIELEKRKLVEDRRQAERDAVLAQQRAKKDRDLAQRAAQLQPRIEALQEDLEELKLKLRDLDKRLTDKRLEMIGTEFGPDNQQLKVMQRQIEALEQMVQQTRALRAKLRDELTALRQGH